MGDIIRIGRVSDIDYKAGMVSVYFEDKTAAVTEHMPVISNNEYNMPAIGELVLVAYLSNSNNQCVVIGSFWNEEQLPREAGDNVYLKIFKEGYSLELTDNDLKFRLPNKTVSLNEIALLFDRVSNLEKKILK